MRVCVVVGHDRRMPEVSKVCAFSIRERSSIDVNIYFLDLSELWKDHLYWRGDDPLASTEFTYSRFLTPYLARNYDIAIYCDNDFLWLSDISELVNSLDGSKAVNCVWHDHQPTETVKMDGQVQTTFPRKNWSSLMVFSIGDPRLAALTPECVNTASGAYLHRFKWLDDSAIGQLESDWNWLEGASERPKDNPKVIHFTRGGPWFDNWQHVAFADLWIAERERMRDALSHENV